MYVYMCTADNCTPAFPSVDFAAPLLFCAFSCFSCFSHCFSAISCRLSVLVSTLPQDFGLNVGIVDGGEGA